MKTPKAIKGITDTIQLAVGYLEEDMQDQLEKFNYPRHNSCVIKSVTDDGLITFAVQYLDLSGRTNNAIYRSNAPAFRYDQKELLELQNSGETIDLLLARNGLFGTHSILNWS
jgi:hypothetical protein